MSIDLLFVYFANVMAKSFHPVTSNGEPKFQRAKSTTQRHTPMLNENFLESDLQCRLKSYAIVDGLLRVFVLQIERIDGHRIDQRKFVTNPKA